jgi:CubicO group peptidase (beta-lactamase class C family)
MTGLQKMTGFQKWLPALFCCALLQQCFQVPCASAQILEPLKQSQDGFRNVDALVDKAVSEGNIPGAVLLVGHNGKIVHRKAFGWRALEPVREPMTIDTVFDLASLTKCIATTTSMVEFG